MRFSDLCRRVIFCACLFASSVHAGEARQHFLDPASIDVKQILADPPVSGSPTTEREVEVVLALQSSRTPADAERTDREGNWSPFLFDDVLGPWFTEKNLPYTTSFLANAGRDVMSVCEAAKKLWSRPRPPLEDKRIHPSVGLPSSSSYPSGHGAYGVVLATILAEFAPDLKAQLMARGKQIGDDRVLGGVHFPSDVEAARTLGPVILGRFRANPEFRASLEKAKEEFRRVRSQHQSSAINR